MADRIPILVVIGSVRPGNYTTKASALVVDELRKDPQVSVEVVDPAKLDLPFPGARPPVESTRRLQEQVYLRRHVCPAIELGRVLREGGGVRGQGITVLQQNDSGPCRAPFHVPMTCSE